MTQTTSSAETSVSTSPLSVDDFEHIKPEEYDADPELIIFAVLNEVRALRARIDDIENKADAMMSPDNMLKMAEGFLGGKTP